MYWLRLRDSVWLAEERTRRSKERAQETSNCTEQDGNKRKRGREKASKEVKGKNKRKDEKLGERIQRKSTQHPMPSTSHRRPRPRFSVRRLCLGPQPRAHPLRPRRIALHRCGGHRGRFLPLLLYLRLLRLRLPRLRLRLRPRVHCSQRNAHARPPAIFKK